ncbi:MAG: hypothetical protein EOL87_00335 [Spartobacteria bacterium]|nr:hypothetical protein [Spartobacteria bacterium]
MAVLLTTDELLAEIREKGIAKTVSSYRREPLSSRTLQDLFETEDVPEARLFLASYPNVPSLILDQIIAAGSLDEELLTALAINPRTANTYLIQLTQHPSVSVRLSLAGNDQLGSKEISLLMQDPAPEVRVALVRNRALSVMNHLPLLAADPEPMVRMAAAQHPKLPEEALFELLNDPNPLVVAHTVMFAKIPEKMIVYLADSDNQIIQSLLLQHKNITEPVYRSLTLSGHAPIRAAASRLNGLEPSDQFAWASSDCEEDRLALLDFPELHPLVQKKLAADASVDVRCKLASYPDIDLETVLLFAFSNDVPSCRRLAMNPNIPEEALTELCHNEHTEVLKVLAYRDDLTLNHLDLLVNLSRNISVIQHLAWRKIWMPSTDADLVEELSHYASPTLRAFAAASQHMTNQLFRQFMLDPSAQVRLWTALNPLLPAACIQVMRDDPDKLVARVIAERAPGSTRQKQTDAPRTQSHFVNKNSWLTL